MTSMLDAALVYAQKGYFVFPCEVRGKKPLTKNGFKNATRDPQTIKKWWAHQLDANIGIALEESGLMVVDLDRHPGKPDGVQAFKEICGGKIPHGAVSLTGGGIEEKGAM